MSFCDICESGMCDGFCDSAKPYAGDQALDLLRRALLSISTLRPKHSKTQIELEIEAFLEEQEDPFR